MNELKTYSKQIGTHIKDLLLRGVLKPGDKVNEVHIASTLSISRAPVREALQMLVQEGLIESIPQRGKFIRSLTGKEIRDSYFIGGVLEGAAISASRHLLCAADFQNLDKYIEKMRSLGKSEPQYAKTLAQLDIGFHDLLLSHCDSPLIVEQSRNVCQRISKFILYRHWPEAFTPEEIVDRHVRVLNAVKHGASFVIESAIREHYQELGERMSVHGRDMQK